MTRDEYFMTLALREAEAAAAEEETPIGAVVVRGGEVIAAAHNGREWSLDITAHAELSAIRAAERAVGDWRLSDCTLYVTLEPCPMCAGAILHARIPRIVCGAMDPVAGAMGSVWALHRHPVENQHPRLETGCLEEACGELLREFFRSRREE